MKYVLIGVACLAVALSTGCKKPEQNQPALTAGDQGDKPLERVEPLDTPPAASPTAVSPRPLPPPSPIAPVAGKYGKTYVVQPGDTFFAIARKVYGSDKRAKDIIAANPNVEPTKLKPGQTINLPD